MKITIRSAFFALVLFAFLMSGCAPAPTPHPPTITPSPIPPTDTPEPIATLAPPSTATPTATALKPVNITAFCTLIGKDSKSYVPPGTPIIITWGWEAKTEEQVDDFIQNNTTTITLDGKIIEGVQVKGIQHNEKSGNLEVVWFAEVGILDAGEHVVTYDVNWSKMIEDGMNTYGPGGKYETLHDECEIIVE